MIRVFCVGRRRDNYTMDQLATDLQGVPKVIIQRFGLIARPVII